MAIVGRHRELNVKGPILHGFAPKEISNNRAKQVKGAIIFICFVQAQISNFDWNKQFIFLVAYTYTCIYIYVYVCIYMICIDNLDLFFNNNTFTKT